MCQILTINNEKNINLGKKREFLSEKRVKLGKLMIKNLNFIVF